MSTAASITNLTRNAAAELVRREERSTGSKMEAYVNVAAHIGASPSWLIKLLRQEASISPVAFNILTAYDRLCARVDQEIENERLLLKVLKRDIDAAIPSLNRVVATGSRAQEAAKENRPPLNGGSK